MSNVIEMSPLQWVDLCAWLIDNYVCAVTVSELVLLYCGCAKTLTVVDLSSHMHIRAMHDHCLNGYQDR